jgi:hypothetical protein
LFKIARKATREKERKKKKKKKKEEKTTQRKNILKKRGELIRGHIRGRRKRKKKKMATVSIVVPLRELHFITLGLLKLYSEIQFAGGETSKQYNDTELISGGSE